MDRLLRRGSRLNPLWLTGTVGGARALDLSPNALGMAWTLAGFYAEVESGEGALGRDATFDLVAAYGRRLGTAELESILNRLRPGGWLLTGVRNRWYVGRLTFGGGPARGDAGSLALRREIGSAGFSEVRSYLAAPSLLDPRVLIPADAPGAAVLRALPVSGVIRPVVSRILSKLGLSHVLFPALVFLAQR